MPFDINFTKEILDSLGEGVFTVDKNFQINFFNKAAERITGLNGKEVTGKFCKHIFKSEVCFSDCPIAQVLKSRKIIYDFESCIKTAENTSKQIKLNAAVLYNNDGEPAGGVISFRDLSSAEVLTKDIEKEINFYGIIGKSKQMKDIFSLIEEISDSDASVFIQGASGTGKELIANAIQKTSRRNNKPFIKINCAVFPDSLLASELFGHIKGAFTDAQKDRPGRFELADGGTIFLDEVAEMPLQMQIQLLRVLQEGTFERIGESITRSTDVRVIAATNININKALQTGKFREDLYYRLNVIPIYIPPIEERKADLLPLINHFLLKYSLIYKVEQKHFDEIAIDKMLNYDWPGNIRELENAIEYAFVRSNKNKMITIDKLPAAIRNTAINEMREIELTKNDKDNEYIIRLLKKYKWNKSLVAKELGIGRTTLWRRLKNSGIELKDVS